jgi:hypothetical protein
MGKGGLLKTVRHYKSTLLIMALLLIIIFSIFNTKKGKIIEHNTNMSKKFLEITAFIDSSNNSTVNHGVIIAFDELKSKYEENSNVSIKTHPIEDYMPWFYTEKTWGPLLKNDKSKTPEAQLKEAKDAAPIVLASVLDKTKGDTIAKGAERNLMGLIARASPPEIITGFIGSVPGVMASNKIGMERFVK